MFKDTPTFSGFSVKDLAAAKEFYSQVLCVDVEEGKMDDLRLKLKGGEVFLYKKDNHEPATFTVLNFVVDDIDKAIDELEAKEVMMERYEGLPAPQDEKGVLRGRAANMGPDIAWFKDPSGNILAVLQN